LARLAESGEREHASARREEATIRREIAASEREAVGEEEPRQLDDASDARSHGGPGPAE
jgi:hypothetical protein